MNIINVFTLHIGQGGASDYINDVHVSIPKKDYDLAIVNHNTCMVELEKAKNSGYTKVEHTRFMCHGIYPRLEQPIGYADSYGAVTPEIQDHLKFKGIKSHVYINPIDLREFRPIRKLPEKPEKLFVMCQNAVAQLNVSKMGFEDDSIPPIRSQRKRLYHPRYNLADGVVGLGRSAFEGLACGRPVMVYDARDYNANGGYDGVITQDNIAQLLYNNCSGRAKGQPFNHIIARDEFLDSYVADTEYYRSIAEQYFDGRKIVQDLISY
jgi:glycosyltransferase involved in cell wall biosynthesis